MTKPTKAELAKYEKLLRHQLSVLTGDVGSLRDEALRASEQDNSVDHLADQGTDKEANDLVAEMIRERIRSIVKDPETAEALCPKDHAFGTKRPCLDTNYYETYNLPHVRLVDLRKTPITTITENGIDDREGNRRPKFLYDHWRQLTQAMKRGADVRGYLYWSLMDNFEWLEGWGPRFGLYRVEFDDAGNGRIVARINDPIRRLAQSRLVPVIWRVPLDALA